MNSKLTQKDLHRPTGTTSQYYFEGSWGKRLGDTNLVYIYICICFTVVFLEYNIFVYIAKPS